MGKGIWNEWIIERDVGNNFRIPVNYTAMSAAIHLGILGTHVATGKFGNLCERCLNIWKVHMWKIYKIKGSSFFFIECCILSL